MFKGARARERVFQIVMWLVSVVLAGFLVGLGSLVIGDLPKVSEPPAIEQFLDRSRLQSLDRTQSEQRAAAEALQPTLATSRANLETAAAAYSAERETFDNWVRTRTATGDPGQDVELTRRTQALDALKAREESARLEQEAVLRQIAGFDTAADKAAAQATALREAAQPAFDRAVFAQEMKVFGLRLALTLPLLGLSAWLLLRRPRSEYWPLQRGFILFSAFAFFVELVPYLPDYGGYVRYGVGVLLTLVVGYYVIRAMRAYLKAREVDESRAEAERVKSIEYDEALKKLAARACPGCDRTLPVVEGTMVDFCVHCGMHLFNRCARCETRKFAFFRYCMTCGTPATGDAEAVSDTPHDRGPHAQPAP